MRFFYYCNSTYQLLNILNLNWHRKYAGFEDIDNYEADLYILNSFEGAVKIAEIVRKQNMFDNVILLEKKFNKGKAHMIKTLMDLVSPSFYFKDKHSISKKDICNRYDVITTPKYSAVVDEMWRLNRKAYLDLIEDGTASYFMVIILQPSSAKIRKMRKLLKYNSFYDYRHLYLVSRDLYTGVKPERIVQIPPFNKEYMEQIRNDFSVFDRSDDKNIFWLSQFLNNKDFNLMVDEVLDALNEYHDDVLFVQHPRNHMENKYGYAETDGKQIWELQVLNVEDINNRLLISVHSTASYTAKMLYDLEPYIILFYKMGDNNVTAVNDDFEEFLRRFKNSYRDPDKIMVPETLEDFKKCLKKYKEISGG